MFGAIGPKTAFLLLALFIVGCADPVSSTDEMEMRDGLAYHQDSRQPYSGVVNGYHANGQLESEYHYKNGKRHGSARNWHPNGQLASDTTYLDGVTQDKLTKWYANGNKAFEATLRNGLAHGKVIEWYENGNKATETDYIEGEMNGRRTQWHEDGELFQTYGVSPVP